MPTFGHIAMQLLLNKIPLFLLLGLLSKATLTAAAQAQIKPPNVIFILVDDQGYYDLGCYGATEVQTPRIDKMASEGITMIIMLLPICAFRELAC